MTLKSKQKYHPALFLDEYYCRSNNPYRTLIRLERILIDLVIKQCLIDGLDFFYDIDWIQTLTLINKTYVSLNDKIKESDSYKLSSLWVAKWSLELIQRRQQLSANTAITALEELKEYREGLINYVLYELQ